MPANRTPEQKRRDAAHTKLRRARKAGDPERIAAAERELAAVLLPAAASDHQQEQDREVHPIPGLTITADELDRWDAAPDAVREPIIERAVQQAQQLARPGDGEPVADPADETPVQDADLPAVVPAFRSLPPLTGDTAVNADPTIPGRIRALTDEELDGLIADAARKSNARMRGAAEYERRRRSRERAENRAIAVLREAVAPKPAEPTPLVGRARKAAERQQRRTTAKATTAPAATPAPEPGQCEALCPAYPDAQGNPMRCTRKGRHQHDGHTICGQHVKAAERGTLVLPGRSRDARRGRADRGLLR